MKIEKQQYRRAKEDARYITEITTQLEFLAGLQDILQKDKIKENYEASRKRDIKNALSNIYLMLELHDVKGVADHIFNPDFKPIE